MAINERVYGGFRRTTGDETGRQLAILLPTDYRVLHLASAADHATDWGVANPTDPTFYVHSATTPATDYLSLAHNGNNGVLTLSGGGLSVSSSAVHIGDDANENLTVGVSINQGANDDSVLEFKSSDVTHLMVTLAEPDSYGAFTKIHPTAGGVIMHGFSTADAAVVIKGHGSTNNTDKDNTARAPVETDSLMRAGDTAGGMGSDANIFVAKENGTTKFIIDEDGDLFADAGTSTDAVTVYDDMPDAMLVRAFDKARSDAGVLGLVRGQWDDYTTANEQALVETGILGAPLAEGGLVNVTRLQQLHNGAIWQLWSDVLDVAKALPAAAQEKLPARIKDRFLALNAG